MFYSYPFSRFIAILLISFLFVACGGGGGSSDTANDQSEDGTSQDVVDIGPIPSDIEYTIELNGAEVNLNDLVFADKSVSAPYAAYNNDDLIYWGNGLVNQLTGEGLNGRSTAIMLIYSLMIAEPMPDFAQAAIISAINTHPLINDIADSLTLLVETNGFMNLNAIDSTAQDNIKTVITDVRQQLIDLMRGSNTVAQKIGAVELDPDGAILTQQGTLTVSKLKFSEASNQVLVDMTMNNKGKWYYETSVVDDLVVPTYTIKNVFNIPPREEADVIDSAWGLLSILTGADQTVTELQLSSSVDINYELSKITTTDVAANRHYLVADPHSPYAIFVNTLNAAAPLMDTIGLPKINGKELVDPTSPFALAIVDLLAAQPNERFDAASTVTDEFIMWVIDSTIEMLPGNSETGSTTITRKLKWFEKVNKIGSAIKTLASITEYIAAVNDLDIKTFVIDPVPITITNVTNNGENNYSVTVKLWGNDVVNATGDDTVELKVLGYRSLTTMPVGSASIDQNPDYIQTFSFTNTEATPTFTFDVTFPDNDIYWISVIPGTDAPCLSSTVCSDAGRTLPDNYLYPEQFKEDRDLVLLDRNLKPICNGDYDTNTDTCWQVTYYASGAVQRRTPYVNGLRQGTETYYPIDGSTSYYFEVPYEIENGTDYRNYDIYSKTFTSAVPVVKSVVSGVVVRHQSDGTVTKIPYKSFTGRYKEFDKLSGRPDEDRFYVISVIDGLVIKTSADETYRVEIPVSSYQGTETISFDDVPVVESLEVTSSINGTVTVTENGVTTHLVPFKSSWEAYLTTQQPSSDITPTKSRRGNSPVCTIEGVMKTFYPNGMPKLYAEMVGVQSTGIYFWTDNTRSQFLGIEHSQQAIGVSRPGHGGSSYPIDAPPWSGGSYFDASKFGYSRFIDWDKTTRTFPGAIDQTYFDTPVWNGNSAASGSVKTYYDNGALKSEMTFEPYINESTYSYSNFQETRKAVSKLTGAEYYYNNGNPMLMFTMDRNLPPVNRHNVSQYLDTKELGYDASKYFYADYLPTLNNNEVNRNDLTGATGLVQYWFDDGTLQLNYNVSTYKVLYHTDIGTFEHLETVPNGVYIENYADGYPKAHRNFQAGTYTDTESNIYVYSLSVDDIDYFDFEYSPGNSVQFEGGYVVNVDSAGAHQLKDGLHTTYNANGTVDSKAYYSSGNLVWGEYYHYNPDGSLNSVTTTGNPSG